MARAHVAQLVEHVLGKDEVTGSIPVMGSMPRIEKEFKKVNDNPKTQPKKVKWPRKQSNATNPT